MGMGTQSMFARCVVGLLWLSLTIVFINVSFFATLSVSADLQTHLDRCNTYSGNFNGYPEISYEQCLGLAQLYEDTDGDNWTNNSGRFSSIDVCDTWYGIYCFYGPITYLDLGNNNLSGHISDLSNLGLVWYLDFDFNSNLKSINLAGASFKELYINDNPGLTSLDLSVLDEYAKQNYIHSIAIYNTNITSLDVSGLTGGLSSLTARNVPLTSFVAAHPDDYYYSGTLDTYTSIYNNNLCEDSLDSNTIAFLDFVQSNWRTSQSCDDPYVIETCEDLQNVNNDLAGSYTLANNIDCTSYGNDVMIGSYQTPFTGSFNGDDYMIEISLSTYEDDDMIALFRVIDGATISNLTVSGSVDVGSDFSTVGGIVGESYYSILDNVHFYGSAVGMSYIGGLIGYAEESSILNSSVNGTVSNHGNYVGGLLGYGMNITIENSSADVVVNAWDEWAEYAGGLVGYITSGYINNASSEGAVIGNNMVGGLIGVAENSSIITSSHSFSSVQGNATVGGLLGDIMDSSLSYVYAIGNITGSNSVGGLLGGGWNTDVYFSYAQGDVYSSNAYAGGLVGYATYMTFSNCYALGDVFTVNSPGSLLGYSEWGSVTNCFSAGGVSGTFNMGGMVGFNNGLTTVFNNSFGDLTNRSEFYDNEYSDGGTGLTTEEMKDILTFSDAGWDIGVNNDEEYNDGYPFFLRQIDPMLSGSIWYINTSPLSGSQYENSWTADNTDPYEYATYTFTFTAPDHINNPYALIYLPQGFSYQGSFYGEITISIDGETPFGVSDGTSLWYPQVGFAMVLGANYQNPDPITSGSVVVITIPNIVNPGQGLYSGTGVLYLGSDRYSTDYSITLNDLQIGQPPVDPFVWCDTNSGSINIPYQECISLAYLYTETNGNDWYENDGWFDNVDVSTWESYECYDYFGEYSNYIDVDLCDYESGLFNDGDYYSLGIALTGEGPVKNVYGINLSYNNLYGAIESGLLYLPELTYINMPDNYVTSINITSNPSLVYIDMDDNYLSWINVSNSPLLIFLGLGDNNDEESWSIYLGNNSLLEVLVMDDLSMEGIDLSNNPLLEYIDLDGNQFTDIDLSGLGNLRYLDLHDNELSSIDLTDLVNLESLDLDDNYLSYVHIPSLALEYLDVGDNNLTGISLLGTAMQYLYLYDNQLAFIPPSFENLVNMNYFDISNNCVDIQAIPQNITDWLDGFGNYDITPQGYCVYVDLTNSLQGDADLVWEGGSFGGSSRGAVNDLEVIRNGYLGDYLGLRGEMNQELLYIWENGPVEISSIHVYREAGGNAQPPNVYYFSYWDNDLEEWVTPDEWIANENHQDFRTQYVFTLDESVTTTAVRLVRTDEGSANGIGLSQWLVFGGNTEEEGSNPTPVIRTSGGGGSSIGVDYCPNGDTSGSYYDGTCDGNNQQVIITARPKLPKLKINQIEKKKPQEFCKDTDIKSKSANFEDIVGTVYQPAVTMMVKHCLMQGYNNAGQEFGVNNPLKRGELYKVFTRMSLINFDLSAPGLGRSYGYRVAGQSVGLWDGISMPKDQEAPVTQKELLQVTMNYLKYMGVLDTVPTINARSIGVTRGEFAKFINVVLGLVSTRE